MEARQCESGSSQAKDSGSQTTDSDAIEESDRESTSDFSGSQISTVYIASSSKLWFANIIKVQIQ